ncbi:MAG: SDR family oxidoreductase [Hydrogenophaga sp.]|uniref:SDR family NAD(P)-dependent oxidoreductase n=1 Tax=Hydrogenophaga sp. TaxID=1904254 RepID=UPI00263A1F16|nr:SDR family NAD(P)-dependent oxidoreductase [Hydrogenophaga sp.]MCV0437463.1 SDR family oxidoreductase [Hydrogenophaga sp.]
MMNAGTQLQAGGKRVALVTGGGSGIGRAAALAWAREGVRLLLVDLDDSAGTRTTEEVRSIGGEADYMHVDVRNEADCSHAVAKALELYGRLDIGFNNAGITGASGVVGKYPLSEWRRVLDVNLTGVFNCMQAQLKVFEKQGSGVIVNTSSVMGLRGTPGGSAYSAAKHGVVGLTRSAAMEYGGRGIRINAICPGFVETPMVVGDLAGIPDHILRDKLSRTAVRRLGTPEEIAAVVLWLASDAASFMHGAAINADGGFLAS